MHIISKFISSSTGIGGQGPWHGKCTMQTPCQGYVPAIIEQ